MAAAALELDTALAWLKRYRDLVTQQRQELTNLDSAIGDADHGANMARGMGAVIDKLDATPVETVDALFKSVGMTLVSSVGGSSGPLYGTFFLRMGTTAGAVTSLDPSALSAALHAGVEGIIARGKAEPGDKTMLDAFGPALEAFDGALGDGLGAAATAAAAAAASGRDATEPMQARKGRASYLGERSVGHIDPGAASAALLFEALEEALGGGGAGGADAGGTASVADAAAGADDVPDAEAV